MTWSDVGVAAAFVLGAIGGTLATVVVMRSLLIYLKSPQGQQEPGRNDRRADGHSTGDDRPDAGAVDTPDH